MKPQWDAALVRLTGQCVCRQCGKEVGVYNIMSSGQLRIMRHFITAPNGDRRAGRPPAGVRRQEALVECPGSWEGIPSERWL